MSHSGFSISLQEFQEKIESLRAANGWMVRIECSGLWTISVFDKASGELLAETGATGLHGVYFALTKPFDSPPWV